MLDAVYHGEHGEPRMNISEAQRDLRRAYVGGGPGVVVSGLVWLTAAVVELGRGVGPAFTALFLGGVLIYPIGTLASRLIFRREKESPGNPLGVTALESTIAMIGGLLAAWLFLRHEPSLVFPLAAVAVGTHYAVFKTVYGDAVFWALAALITAAGVLGIFGPGIPGGTIFFVAAVEIILGVVLILRDLRST